LKGAGQATIRTMALPIRSLRFLAGVLDRLNDR
jgi:hypothetical protein